MKVVILAGGLGTRLSEETASIPKPMIDIAGKPLIWHVMKSYARFGINDFVILCGYKGYVIKEYFANYFINMSNVTFDFCSGERTVHSSGIEHWRVTLLDTGEFTQTGGRLKRASSFLGEDTFLFTYGDGVADVDVTSLIDFHKQSGRLATVTAVQPPGRFGMLDLSDDRVDSFLEKPSGDGSWINGGFFVLEPQVLSLIKGDETVWEKEPLIELSALGELGAFKHSGIWQPVDSLRDKNQLIELVRSGALPW